MVDKLEKLVQSIRECKVCTEFLPFPPRPVLRAQTSARLLIVGQAPGLKVHQTGIPWNDPSGDRLRSWLGIDRKLFYDDRKIAIIPMGFCYPGRHQRGGDLPPRSECARLWRAQLLNLLPNIQIIVLAGMYAQQWHLGERAKKTLTETVHAWREYSPTIFPLPHPSFRNNLWLRENVWFEQELLPELREHIKLLMQE